ncbi:capsular biosynthesis protein [Lysinibacillus sp. 2017]|uniref:YveK family protein n=1 Tax=unclassified Lysinibacillus TaxID=2636778 RepID=UPI000D527723|nr:MULTISPECIES: Wzz/FepE/Etk N-terminal domain-containing protein [unclassified Lysinibacillus]AWE06773.1 capsular biosynthesis protein [Lysinibacillus sp. 2017]TGN37296.1 capsular biosynthesis protein [Lysinibacillus sp. S2017]
MEETISLQEIAKIIRKRLLLIIILMVISVGISAGISFYVLTPIYQAQTQILVNQNSNPEEAYSWNSTETDLRLINTYNVIITSPVILTPVIEELELDVTPGQLMSQISVSNESGSKVVNISVLDANPLQAVEISNTVAEVFKKQIPKLMSVDNITILSAAKLSDTPSPVKPNKRLNIAIAAVIGLMLGVGIAFLMELLDTTIKNEKDIEEILGLPVIGVVGSIVEEKEKRSSLISRRARRNYNV